MNAQEAPNCHKKKQLMAEDSLGLTRDAAMELLGIDNKYRFGAWVRRKRAQGIEIKMDGLNLYRRDLLIEAATLPASRRVQAQPQLSAYEKQKRKQDDGGKTSISQDGKKAKRKN
jgi:hypothetical protein